MTKPSLLTGVARKKNRNRTGAVRSKNQPVPDKKKIHGNLFHGTVGVTTFILNMPGRIFQICHFTKSLSLSRRTHRTSFSQKGKFQKKPAGRNGDVELHSSSCRFFSSACSRRAGLPARLRSSPNNAESSLRVGCRRCKSVLRKLSRHAWSWYCPVR